MTSSRRAWRTRHDVQGHAECAARIRVGYFQRDEHRTRNRAVTYRRLRNVRACSFDRRARDMLPDFAFPMIVRVIRPRMSVGPAVPD